MDKPIDTHRSASLVVMQVHLLPQGLPSLARVDELATKSEPESDVVAAAAPLPDADVRCGCGAAAVRRAVDVRIVARARLDGAFCAGAGDGVRHASAGDRVDEGGLSTACGAKEREG